MPVTLELTPDERPILAFAMPLVADWLNQGTSDHREVGASLRSVYEALVRAAEGPATVELSRDELYYLGLRLYPAAVQLEDYWLENKENREVGGEPAPFPSVLFERLARAYFPDAIDDPSIWDFETVAPFFGGVQRKLDELIRTQTRARGLYQREKTAIVRRLHEQREERARHRRTVVPLLGVATAFRRVARLEDLPPGALRRFDVDGKPIVALNLGGEVRVVDAICSHMKWNLARGWVEAGDKLTCSAHGAQYDVHTGRCVRGPFAPEFNRKHFFNGRLLSWLMAKRSCSDIRAYEAKVEDGEILVNLA